MIPQLPAHPPSQASLLPEMLAPYAATDPFGASPAADLFTPAPMATLPVPHPIPVATFADRTRDAVAHLNKHAPVLRMGMPNSPNMGHQTATVEVARRLRVLGYRGNLEMVCTDAAQRAKLHLLLPTLEQAGVRALQLLTPEAARAEARTVGFLGGSESPADAAAALNVRYCLVLQPLHWRMPRGISNLGALHEIDMPADAALHLDPPDGTPSAIVQRHLEGPRWSTTRRNLRRLLGAVSAQRIDLQVAYGLHRTGHSAATALNLLVTGNDLAQSLSAVRAKPKPTVVLAILPDPKLTRIPEHAPAEPSEEPVGDGALHMPYPCLQTRHSAHHALSALKSSGARDRTRALVTRTLPEPVFRMLFAESTLPPVLEGANTTNLMRRLQRPYLSVHTQLTPFPERFPNDPQAYAATLAAGHFAMPHAPGSAQGFAESLVTARDCGAMRDYFHEIGANTHAEENDMVALGLQTLHRRLQSGW